MESRLAAASAVASSADVEDCGSCCCCLARFEGFLLEEEDDDDAMARFFFFLPDGITVSGGSKPRSTEMAIALGMESHDLPLLGAVHLRLLRFCITYTNVCV